MRLGAKTGSSRPSLGRRDKGSYRGGCGGQTTAQTTNGLSPSPKKLEEKMVRINRKHPTKKFQNQYVRGKKKNSPSRGPKAPFQKGSYKLKNRGDRGKRGRRRREHCGIHGNSDPKNIGDTNTGKN